MSLTPRQDAIMETARAEGRVWVDQLAAAFDVTTQTIRRDLNELSQLGLLARVHGGATPAPRVTNVDYAERRALASEAKQAIGALAASHIPDGCSLILNVGTTTEQVAHALRGHRNLVVVTNNINVVAILSDAPGAQLILAGGLVRPADGAIVGEEAVAFMRKFKVDFAVIGASALDEEGAVLDFDMREVSVARAIVENARQTILVADRQKFDRAAPVRICDAADLDLMITDRPPPKRFLERCAEHGVEVSVVGADPKRP